MTYDPSLDTRHAGEVVRYHAWKTLQHQTVGEHSWQVLRIYDELFRLDSPVVVRYILYHDAAELVTGDVPFGAKRRSPALKAASDEAAEAAAREMEVYVRDVSPEERDRVKLCDLVEMYEFGVREVQMGSQLGCPIVRATAQAVLDMEWEGYIRERVDKYLERHSCPALGEASDRKW